MERECISPFSLPIDTMSAQDLRKCVTRPLRFKHSLLEQPMPLLSKRVFQLDYNENASGRYTTEVPLIYPFPGGRWLLTARVDHDSNQHLFCWDLAQIGSVRAHGISIRYSAECNIGLQRLRRSNIQYDPTGQRVMFLSDRPISDGLYVIIVLILHTSKGLTVSI